MKKARRAFVNPIFKDKVTVLKTKEETGGMYMLSELEVSPGGGNFMVHLALNIFLITQSSYPHEAYKKVARFLPFHHTHIRRVT